MVLSVLKLNFFDKTPKVPIEATLILFKFFFLSFHLCTHEEESNKGHCQGDSGGPLFLKGNDMRYEFEQLLNFSPYFAHSRFIQIGVASFGSILNCTASPGGFSRLNHDVLQWIRRFKVKSLMER